MASIHYGPLNSSAGEIRLLTILPKSYSSIPTHQKTKPSEKSGRAPASEWRDSWDLAVKRLVDMGYSKEKAQEALTESGAGLDISAAIQWLHDDVRKDWQRLKMKISAMADPKTPAAKATTSSAHMKSSSAPQPMVECILEKVSIWEPNLSFTALSYTWGDPAPTSPIRIGDQIVQVRSNLEHALRQIREPSTPVCIWVDAICIDQSNTQEKNEQVLGMQNLYQRATSVTVWLGSAADDSDKAMVSLDMIGKVAEAAGIFKLSTEAFRTILKPIQDAKQMATASMIKRIATKIQGDIPYKAVNALSLRSYWRRIWIIQEVSVGQEATILCGTRRVPFSRFAAGMLFVHAHLLLKSADRGRELAAINPIDAATMADPEKMAAMFARIEALQKDMIMDVESPDSAVMILAQTRMRYHSEHGSSPETLEEVIRRECVDSKHHPTDRATDPRDVIWGLLGLASDKEKVGIVVDYSQKVEDAYTKATRQLLRNGSIGVLSWCQHPKSLPGLPSWVPDFSTSILKPCGEERRRRLFSAAGKTAKEDDIGSLSALFAMMSWNPGELMLSCATISTIERLGACWNANRATSSDFDFAAAKTYFETIDSYCQLAPFPAAWQFSPAREAAKWRIPTGDLERQGTERFRATPAHKVGYDDLRKWIDEQPASHKRPRTFAAETYMMCMGSMHSRRPFLSKDRRVGLAPAQAEVGDVVCLVFEADLPFLLRQVSTRRGKPCYRLIGEAYVHGIMDGELRAAKGELKWELMTVC